MYGQRLIKLWILINKSGSDARSRRKVRRRVGVDVASRRACHPCTCLPDESLYPNPFLRLPLMAVNAWSIMVSNSTMSEKVLITKSTLIAVDCTHPIVSSCPTR